MQAAARELTRRGSTSIVAGGDALVASGAAPAAPKIQGLSGLALLSPLHVLVGLDRADHQEVDVISGSEQGVALLKADPALQDRLIEFIGEAQPKSFLARWAEHDRGSDRQRR